MTRRPNVSNRRRPGIVVIDHFLRDAALDLLYRFCLESTVWFGNRYAHGRLGAFFLGVQLPSTAAAGRGTPRLDSGSDRIYGIRCGSCGGSRTRASLPADSTIHADFAAINVNCWITPTSANLDESSGGMVIYDVAAPQSWDFATYNERIDLIREFLSQRRARAIRVPYRQNRAIIFNSDLFHATEAVRFKPDYESHRINITLLYGERQRDSHHPLPSNDSDLTATVPHTGWRSAAFSRSRR